MSDLQTKSPEVNPSIENLLEHCHKKHYASRSRIIHAGDSSHTLYYIIRGSVSVMIEDENGHEMVLAYLNKNEFFGEMGLFDPEPRSALVVAREDCEVAEIHYSKFQSLIEKDPGILMELTRQIANRLRTTSKKVISLAFLDVTGRVARTLMELAKQPDSMTHPEGMQIRITRQEIAKIVGCSREMAGRVLKDLEDQGLITAKGKTIVILGAR